MLLPLLTLAAGAGAAPPSGWKTCGGLPDSYNNTACPATQTCATQKWQPSPGSWGCCPLPNAVQCEGGYTCCPSGTKCQNKGSGWQVVSTCVPSDANDSGVQPSASRVVESAPASMSNIAMPTWSLAQAMCSGVEPSVFVASGSAPCSSRHATTATCPWSHAQ